MTSAELARELAERNERCGHFDDNQICLRPRQHAGEHQFEPIERVIPIA